MWEYLQIEGGNQMTSHFPLSGITNTSRGSTSKGLLPPHLKGRERPITFSARRASRCSRAAGATAGGEMGRKERSFTLDSPRGWGAIIANHGHRPVRSASALTAGQVTQNWSPNVKSRRINAHVIGYVSVRPHVTYGWSERVKAPTYLCFSKSKSLW